MDVATDFPSLMDDTEFLSELEKIESAPPPRAADRASHVALATGFDTASRALPSASTRPLAVREAEPPPLDARAYRREVNRWPVPPAPALEDAETPGSPASWVPAFLTILVGFSAGAAGSALIFHERVTWLLQLWRR